GFEHTRLDTTHYGNNTVRVDHGSDETDATRQTPTTAESIAAEIRRDQVGADTECEDEASRRIRLLGRSSRRRQDSDQLVLQQQGDRIHAEEARDDRLIVRELRQEAPERVLALRPRGQARRERLACGQGGTHPSTLGRTAPSVRNFENTRPRLRVTSDRR